MEGSLFILKNDLWAHKFVGTSGSKTLLDKTTRVWEAWSRRYATVYTAKAQVKVPSDAMVSLNSSNSIAQRHPPPQKSVKR